MNMKAMKPRKPRVFWVLAFMGWSVGVFDSESKAKKSWIYETNKNCELIKVTEVLPRRKKK